MNFHNSLSALSTALLTAALSSGAALAQADPHSHKTLVAGPGPDSVLITSVSGAGERTQVARPVPDASAPPLSKIFINNVCTDAAGTACETIATNQTSTTNTYHGAAAYVFVWEIGYGTGETATQGGTQISSANLVSKVPVCVSGGYYTTSCPAGSTVYGYRYEWNSGYYLNLGYAQNFQAQDTSINSPYNTISVSLNILYSH